MATATKIGIIAEARIVGASIPQAAQMAADEINAAGDVDGRAIEIVAYDNRSSSVASVHAFQHAVMEEKVHAVIGNYIGEIVLALGPWASRLKTPFVTPGAASTEISRSVLRAYEKNRYTFHGYLTSAALAQSVAEAAGTLLVEQKRPRTAVIMSEDAAWTEPLDSGCEVCLPTIGLTLLDDIRFAPDTADFTAIFTRIKDARPDVIITGMPKAGVEPIKQWKKLRVPIPMLGMNSQASNSSFFEDADGAAQGVLYQAVAGPGVAVTARTISFAEGFRKRFGNYPSYYPGRTGEIYLVQRASHHRWAYFSEMDRNEALVFKQYDSQASGVSRSTPHSAFDLPDIPPDAPLRERIEIRCLVTYG